MIAKGDKDLRALMRIGQICGEALQHMLRHVEPGISTRQLDDIGAAFLRQHDAISAPITAYQFPGWTCISLNDEAAHGIPREDRIIEPGDLVNIDVSAILEGYWGDTGASMIVPPTTPEHERLLKYTRKALYAGINAAHENNPLYAIGRAVQDVAKEGGYTILRQLGGHGVGRGIHEEPTVYNYFTKRAKKKLKPGMVLTIEPFFHTGRSAMVTKDEDGWTLRTKNRTPAAQFEHSVVINGEEPILLTKVAGSH